VLSLLFAFLNLVTVLYQEGCTLRRIGFVLVFAENKKIFEKREYKRKSGLPHEQTAKRKDVVLKRQDVTLVLFKSDENIPQCVQTPWDHRSLPL